MVHKHGTHEAWKRWQKFPDFISASTNSFGSDKQISMSKLIDEFLSNPTFKRSESTITNYLVITRAINEVIGGETLVHEVTREQCKEIGKLLKKFPKNAFKLTGITSIKAAINIAEKSGLPLVSVTTYNGYMHTVTSSALISSAKK